MDRRVCQLLLLAGPLFCIGCYNPYPYQSPYGQPGYGVPQNMPQQQFMPQAPGTLIIPENSSAPPYEPNSSPSTFDREPDDWNRSNNSGSFYNEDGVPPPREREGGSDFDSDFGPGASTQSFESSAARPVSSARPVPYGFDEQNYRWLRGILRYNDQMQRWNITYDLKGNDRYSGVLSLLAEPDQQTRFRRGATVQVTGQVSRDHRDSQGRPMYRVTEMEPIHVPINR